MKINCIAIDDEPLALDKMKLYISKVSFLNLTASFNNGLETLDYLKNNKVDLMFLDVQMEDLTGIQLLSVLKEKPKVILTTAYDQYALKGYELDVCDYLLKPISFDRFLQAVTKVHDQLNKQKEVIVKTVESPTFQAAKDNFIFVKTEYRMQKVNFDDIQYIEGMKDYLRLVTSKDKIMTLMNFQNMLDLLPADNFIRIHKSYIISIDKIDHIDKSHVVINNTRIPIGESFKQLFMDHLKKRNLL